MSYLYISFRNGGSTLGKTTSKVTKDGWVNMEIVRPYNGSSEKLLSYYILNRKFQTLIGNHGYSTSILVSKDTHPELFI